MLYKAATGKHNNKGNKLGLSWASWIRQTTYLLAVMLLGAKFELAQIGEWLAGWFGGTTGTPKTPIGLGIWV